MPKFELQLINKKQDFDKNVKNKKLKWLTKKTSGFFYCLKLDQMKVSIKSSNNKRTNKIQFEFWWSNIRIVLKLVIV